MRARPLLLSGALLIGALAAQAEGDCSVSAEQWSRPRSVAMVLGLPGVRECVLRWNADPRQRLVLLHAPGEEASLWATELRDWLVALGVPAARIDLRAVGADPELVLLRVEAPLTP